MSEWSIDASEGLLRLSNCRIDVDGQVEIRWRAAEHRREAPPPRPRLHAWGGEAEDPERVPEDILRLTTELVDELKRQRGIRRLPPDRRTSHR